MPLTQMRQTSSSNNRNTNSQLLTEALMPVLRRLEHLKPLLKSYLSTQTKASQQIIDHVCSSQGKLVRPALFYLVCDMTGYQGKHLDPIAAVCEYVHTASLLHDDVVDSSQLRRNKPSANSIWGDESSVLVGDLIYSTASELMADTGYLEIVKTFANSIKKMSEGELLQLESLFDVLVPEETYFKILHGKTATLMGSICKAAGVLSEVSNEQKNALEHFGLYIGTAFQLVDDALDYIGDKNTVGKEVHADLLEGKITLPIILLREQANESEMAQLANIFNVDKLKVEDLNSIIDMVLEKHIPAKVMEIAEDYTRKALTLLKNHFPESNARANLESVARSLVYRLS